MNFNYLIHSGPFDQRLPLEEGKYPQGCSAKADEELTDEEPRETEAYYLSGKEEYWGFETICKKCRTKFMAYDKDEEVIRNYCPGCGAHLK